jgi:hypothetical protein
LELISGVVSADPVVVGNSGENRWRGKYLTDRFGRIILDENNQATVNAAFDPNTEYVPRSQRPEWVQIGLMGRLPVFENAPVNPRWIKLRGTIDGIEEWLVR